uniref:Solute carrier family 3 member 2 N-terminal domain-containing protein n=1 Tax=Dicentrarchus labrax TaxID=13489 RepID=A0A8C4DBT2_DICLA
MEQSDREETGSAVWKQTGPNTNFSNSWPTSALPGPGLSGSEVASESAPLLIPVPEPESVQEWQPMSKQQLEVAAGGPGWRKVRCYLVLLFWLAWVAMLATSIAIVVMSPRPVATPLRWWQKSLFYQLQPDLFTEGQAEESGGVNGEEIPNKVKYKSKTEIWF